MKRRISKSMGSYAIKKKIWTISSISFTKNNLKITRKFWKNFRLPMEIQTNFLSWVFCIFCKQKFLYKHTKTVVTFFFYWNLRIFLHLMHSLYFLSFLLILREMCVFNVHSKYFSRLLLFSFQSMALFSASK